MFSRRPVQQIVKIGNFDGVSIHYDHNHSDPVRATIAYSSDDSTYTNVGTVGDWAGGENTIKSGVWSAPGRKRYWRINFTDPNDGNISSSDFLYEITFTQGGVAVTNKSSVTVSSGSLSGSGPFVNPSNAYDGDDATYANLAGSYGAFIKLDFGA